MKDRLNKSYGANRITFEHDREMQLLNNMESVHLRKKAAFDELLKYTYNNLKEPTNNRDNNPETK